MSVAAEIEVRSAVARAEGPWSNLALETMGWKAFQDLCSQVCQELLKQPIQIYRDAQDGGQDAVFIVEKSDGTVDATVQCKHSSNPQRRLKIGDLADEFKTVEELVAHNQADTYFLITSMGIDAPVAVEIRATLRHLGVRKPHVFGREFLVRVIRSSATLRALVPQVYGLGDLGAILDQRAILQTRALLDDWIPKAKVYVPTEAHRKAVRSLKEHGIVLLLGNPSSGKSTIAAILSTVASEETGHTVLSLNSPREFSNSWNPADRNRFFWIDDAFGPNSLREEYVHDWSATFPKVQAAILRGNRFVLTSRRHIYEAARLRFGQRSLGVFRDGSAVVNVGELTFEEKSQILYNHINFGGQAAAWKRAVKDNLVDVAGVREFLPGIAERLANPAFTKSLGVSKAALIRFMSEPRGHLVETIQDLERPLQAALVLVYVHQGRVIGNELTSEASQSVASAFDLTISSILPRMKELLGSYLRVATQQGQDVWSFSHPTIADALTDILQGQPHMTAALVHGASVETVLNGFTCEGAKYVRDIPQIPRSLNDFLARRIVESDDTESVNSVIFSFLDYRGTDDILRSVIEKDRFIFGRMAWNHERSAYNSKYQVMARAHKMDLLSSLDRALVVEDLRKRAIEHCDLSFLEYDVMLQLFEPRELIVLGMSVQTELLPNLTGMIELKGENADLSEEPDSHFKLIADSLRMLEDFASLDEDTLELINDAHALIAGVVDDLKERKEQEESSPGDWRTMDDASEKAPVTSSVGPAKERRSIFSDVDL